MICENCIGVKALNDWFHSKNEQAVCSYCGIKGPCIPKETFLQYTMDRFSQIAIPIDELSGFEQIDIYGGSDEHYVQTYNIFIEERLETKNEDLMSDIVDFIGSEISNKNSLFVFDEGKFTDNEYDCKWAIFLNEICHSKRFFNKDAYKFLDKLFEHIHSNNMPSQDYIEALTPETKLFRARKCNNKSIREKIVGNPSSQLGPVPSKIASNQRMTPVGISSLYCAIDRETCLSEIRSITGDIVISGGFVPKERLKLLAISNISDKSSHPATPYNEEYRDIRHRLRFIRKLTNLMSRPSPNGGALDYISTQCIFEYFRVKFGKHVDGLIYNSVQNNSGKNIVLFPEASTIEPFKYDSEKEAIAEESFFSDPYPHRPSFRYFSVKLKGKSEPPNIESDHSDLEDPFYEPPPEYKLQFIQNSLIIHKIKSVITTSKDEKINMDLKN